MWSLALKLLALLAYMAMPFTMSAAMAAPPPAPPTHEAGMVGMLGMEHCPGQSAPTIDHGAFIGCAMMCAALPDAGTVDRMPLTFKATPPAPSRIRTYSGIYLEIATPPPRIA